MSSRYTPFVPDYAHQAFEKWYLYSVKDELYEEFAGKWGGFEYAHFLHALKSGEKDDRFCAMFALGASSEPDSAGVLSPFLTSEERDDRCISAIALGMRGDVQAYPFLEKLLLEGLSLEERLETFSRDEPESLESLFLSDRFRPRAVQLLATWNSPTLLATLLATLQALWIWEKASSRVFRERTMYEALFYALGQRGDFTTLNTMDFPPAFRRIACVYLALGALGAEPVPTMMRWVLGHEEQTRQFLSDTFHLDWEAASYSIDTFYLENEVLRAYQRGLDDQAIEEGQATHFIQPVSASFSQDETTEPEEEADEEEPIEQREPERLCFNRGHTSTVWSLAWSPDGKYLASGSEDSTVQILNAQTGKQIRIFHGHTSCVTVVGWSPDGAWIASSGCDKTILIWNPWSGKVVTTYTRQDAWIWNGLAWSPDSRHIASAAWDGSVHIWEALTGKTHLDYRGHRGIITCVAWSPDGTRVVSGGGYPECAISVWDAFTGQQSLLYQGHMKDTLLQRPVLEETDPEIQAWWHGPGSLRSIAWSPDGKWIASVGLRHIFRVWSAQTGEDLIARAQNRTMGPLAWSPDSKYVASANYTNVDFWYILSKRITLTYTPVSQYPVTALAWSPDMQALATGAQSPRIGVWKVNLTAPSGKGNARE